MNMVGGRFVHITSPTMIEDPEGKNIFNKFGERRQLYEQLKIVEKVIYRNKLLGWVTSTKITKPNVMKLIAKWGGSPYKIDIKNDEIWFQKRVNKIGRIK